FDNPSRQRFKLFAGAELAPDARAQVVVKIVNPITAVDPPGRAFFATVHDERCKRLPGVSQRNHGLRKAGSHLTYVLDQTLGREFLNASGLLAMDRNSRQKNEAGPNSRNLDFHSW